MQSRLANKPTGCCCTFSSRILPRTEQFLRARWMSLLNAAPARLSIAPALRALPGARGSHAAEVCVVPDVKEAFSERMSLMSRQISLICLHQSGDILCYYLIRRYSRKISILQIESSNT